MIMNKVFGGLAAIAMAATTFGCTASGSVTTSPPPVEVVSTGTLTVTWTIAGDTDPGLCDYYGIDAFELVIFDASGREYTTVNQSCQDFGLTVQLPDGFYSADATLIDFN